MKCVFAVLAVLVTAAPVDALPKPPAAPFHLRCEHLANPIGIDAARPRLGWWMAPGARGERQSAYRLLVASSEALLAKDQGDLWDTGKVSAPHPIELPYGGKPLASFQQCFWKVRVWNQTGKASPWSAPATWTAGVMHPRDWKAEWISYSPPPDRLADEEAAYPSFDGCHWIWYPESDPHDRVPAGTRYFRAVLTLPADASIQSAFALVTADDQFVLTINGREATRSDGQGFAWQRPRNVRIQNLLHPGPNAIAIEAVNSAQSPAGVLARFQVRLSSGVVVTKDTGADWLCSSSAQPGWQTAAALGEGWVRAMDLGAYGVGPWHVLPGEPRRPWPQKAPSPIFRKEFVVHKPVRRALLAICGLGYFEAHINGRKVGDHVLDPAFTAYDHRCLYVVLDATHLLRPGRNAIGVMLGNGFYNQAARDAWDFQKAPWRGAPRLLAQLHIQYRDGSASDVVTDDTWHASSGPIVRDGTRNGELYDARLEKPGWDLPGYADASWPRAARVEQPAPVLQAQMAPPIKVMATIRPVRITQPKPGVFIVDMGQTFAGWARIRVHGPSGTRVTLRYGERLNEAGLLEQAQIAGLVYEGPFQTDTYILKGQGTETWETHFAYHGYRYVEVTGFPGDLSPGSIVGRVVHTSFSPAGAFTCSSDLLNAIQRLTLWSYRSNFVGIPTDCPHREKNGWTGDAQLACEQAQYNWQNTAGYEKWMFDFDDALHADGDLPGIVPSTGWGYGIGPAWDSAYILIPWYLYLYQGDTRVLQQHYAGMKKYLDYLMTRAHGYIVDYGLGDWVPYKTDTPVAVTSTAYAYVDCSLMARIAQLLGRGEDVQKYTVLAQQIRDAFNRRFIQPDGSVANNSQTALSCALYQGLAPDEVAPLIARKLAADIEAKADHLDTGILGAKYVFHMLSRYGLHDLACRVAEQTTEPSYGNWVERGATTLWEDWSGAASLDHIMFGDISAWFYQTLAGINPDPQQPGFRHFFIRPMPGADLTWVRAWHASPFGVIESAWRTAGSTFTLRVTVPPDTTATVTIPGAEAASVRIGGRVASSVPGIHVEPPSAQGAVFTLEPGSYVFTTQRR
ncbi:MAG: glycoside hydrolase family 78 protein [Chthonomonadales bacterium]